MFCMSCKNHAIKLSNVQAEILQLNDISQHYKITDFNWFFVWNH